MKNFILIFSFCILIAAGAGAYFLLASPTTAPQFTDDQGTTVALPSASKIYLHFWGSWCQPCVMELPALDAYAAKRPDIAIYAIHIPRGPQTIESIQETYDKLQIKHLKIYQDPGNKLAQHFHVQGFPTTIEVTQDFKEVKRLLGPQQWQYYS